MDSAGQKRGVPAPLPSAAAASAAAAPDRAKRSRCEATDAEAFDVALFAEAPRGLEFVAAAEVAHALRGCGGSVAASAHVRAHDGMGVVEFGFVRPADRAAAAAAYEAVLALRTTDDVYAQFVCVPRGVPTEHDAGLAFLLVAAAEADGTRIRTARRVLRDVAALTARGLPRREDGAPPDLVRCAFRATCDRCVLRLAQRHGYSRVEAAGWAGSGLQLRTAWPIALAGFDVQQHVHCCDDAAWMGLALTRRAPKTAMHRRHHTALCKTTMKASIAAAMCLLANGGSGAGDSGGPDDGGEFGSGGDAGRCDSPRRACMRGWREKPRVVCDMMCGSGTIPLEAAAVAGDAPCCVLGGEVASAYAASTLANLRACGRAGAVARRVSVLNWDARALPLRSGVVDAVVCDMPYGLRCGNARKNARMYGAILAEVARVLAPGARAWLLTTETKLVRRCLADVPQLQHTGSYCVDNSGLPVELFCLTKPAERGQ